MSAVVVRLPTAARYRVKQHHNRAARAERATLPQFPDRYICPQFRAAAEKIRPVREAGAAADRQLLMALLRAVDKTTQSKAAIFLAISATKEGETEAAQQALAIMEYEAGATTRTNGDCWAIRNALDLMDEGRL